LTRSKPSTEILIEQVVIEREDGEEVLVEPLTQRDRDRIKALKAQAENEGTTFENLVQRMIRRGSVNSASSSSKPNPRRNSLESNASDQSKASKKSNKGSTKSAKSGKKSWGETLGLGVGGSKTTDHALEEGSRERHDCEKDGERSFVEGDKVCSS
jgi:hypothetical protein